MKRFFSRALGSWTKRLVAVAIFGLAVMVPVSSFAADMVELEGAIGVANVTRGDTLYKSDVNASYDEVVKVEVYYHNREDPNSGKVAKDLRVKIDMPTTAGTTQVIRETTSASNASNTVQKSATVHLNRADATLDYIPGSAVWKHNVGTNENVQYREDKISDAIVTSGQGFVLEDEKPCFNFAATVTVLARVHVPSVSVTKGVRKAGEGKAVTQLDVVAGERLEYLLTAKNLGNAELTNVYLRDALPAGVTFVPGTVKLFNGPNPGGVAVGDQTALFKGGVNTGKVGPGATVFITFEATVKPLDQLQCGVNNIKNIVVVKPDQTGEYNNSATVNVTRTCAQTPVFSCDLLDVTSAADRKVAVSQFKTTAQNGATFKNAVINWGDGSQPLTTNTVVGQAHQYAKDGSYNITAVAHFAVTENGKVVDKTATSANCAKTVKFESNKPVPPTPVPPTTPPTVLPNTGAGDVAAIFAATSIAGMVAYSVYTKRSLARR